MVFVGDQSKWVNKLLESNIEHNTVIKYAMKYIELVLLVCCFLFFLFVSFCNLYFDD